MSFDIEYISLANKPKWFVELSPLGKVPTLEVTQDDGEKVVLFESAVINEYLDEVTDGSLLPTHALPRARARAWIEFANEVLKDSFDLTSAKDEAALEPILSKLNAKLDRLEREIEGPYFLGAEVSLVDAAFVPALQRLAWSDEIYPELAVFGDRPKLDRWWNALSKRQSVRDSAIRDLRERLLRMVARDRGGYQSFIGARVAKG